MRTWLVGMLLVLASAGGADAVEGDTARTFTPYTLAAVTLAPSASGENLTGYDGPCTVQLVVESGEIRVDVEASNLAQNGTPLGFLPVGTLQGSTLQDVTGGMQRVRLHVTCCQTDCTVDPGSGPGSCTAKAALRCRRD